MSSFPFSFNLLGAGTARVCPHIQTPAWCRLSHQQFIFTYWRDFLERSTAQLVSKFIVWCPPLILCLTLLVRAGLAPLQSQLSAGPQRPPSVSSREFCHTRSMVAPEKHPQPCQQHPVVVLLNIWGCGNTSSTVLFINDFLLFLF